MLKDFLIIVEFRLIAVNPLRPYEWPRKKNIILMMRLLKLKTFAWEGMWEVKERTSGQKWRMVSIRKYYHHQWLPMRHERTYMMHTSGFFLPSSRDSVSLSFRFALSPSPMPKPSVASGHSCITCSDTFLCFILHRSFSTSGQPDSLAPPYFN